MKATGILMPVASLPSDYGIGDFGSSTYEFIELLSKAKVRIWQILPLHALGYGNSPYQPHSSFAGDLLYISPEQLLEDGLLQREDYEEEEIQNDLEKLKNETRIDYTLCRSLKEKLLRKAFERFQEWPKSEEYLMFTKEEWVYQYAVYSSLKRKNHFKCWTEWPKREREWIRQQESEEKTTFYDESELAEEIAYEIFVQFIFRMQWDMVRKFANKHHVKIMGDVPFYVGIDSLDVWANQKCFLLDSDNRPTFIAGVPPDYFSETGQRWGNPIYDWEYLKKTEYEFWMKRFGYCKKLYDVIRIDHFRAFDTYWKIPESCPTAIEGEWIEAPGYEVFDHLYERYPDINIVVEDLGDLRKEVHALRDHYSLKGMKILQFAFDPKEDNNNFEDREQMIVYTGTHDNQTIRGWYEALDKKDRKEVRRELKNLGYHNPMVSWDFIEMALDSVAEYAIIPVQDLLNLGDEARINVPGTVGSPNWEWRLLNYKKLRQRLDELEQMIIEKGRGGN